jgi:hypothetical protein
MPGGAKTLQEYLVSLGVKLDEKGMTKMEGFLKSSKMGFLALAGIMVTAATVATKWAKQINENELALEKEAKAQHKSIEAVRASENALKAMGKTKQEIAKDKSLKAVYDDMVKMNKAMALPDGSRGLSLVRSIRDEFLKFKSTIQYAMQWVNYHIISKLEGPLTRIRDTMTSWREKLAANMPMWTAKIADGIAVFIRLLETAVRFGGSVINFIQKLPAELKVMGTAVYGLWSIIRAGPLGWLLGGLTALLLLLDDFYGYKNGEPSALAGLWEGLDDGTFGDKIVTLAQKGINSFIEFMKKPETQAALKEAVDILLGVVGSLINGAVAMLMNSLPQSIQDFLGWDTGANGGVGGWKTDQKNVPVVSKGEDVTVEDQGTVPSKYPGVVYKNYGGILTPELAPEYQGKDWDTEVPQDVKDAFTYLGERFQVGNEPLLEQPESKPSTGGEIKSVDQTLFDDFKSFLEGTNGEDTWNKDLPQWEHYPKLKEAYDTESGRLENGEISKKDYDQAIDAIIKGAVSDYRNATEFFSDDHQYLQWYEAFKNGTVIPKSKDENPDGAKPEYGIDGDVEVRYDPSQVTQATKEATRIAQGAVNPIYVPLIPTYGEDGDVEIRYDQNQGKTPNALGGRYDKPTETTLVEQGEPEYVIPIKKLNRAIPLIRMMLSEMGSKAKDALAGLGITPDTDINQFVASKGLGMPGGGNPIINIVNNNTYTVTANPVINVNGAGQDPQAVGQAAYNAQERFLVRTLKAVVQSE